MELERARALLAELADGVDPLTGECLPPDSVCNRPEIIRALHCVLQHTAGGRKRPSPPNAGKPWTEADDSALLQMYDAGSDVGELKTHFQRSRTAIIRRLEHLGRVQPGNCSDEKHPAHGLCREPGALTMGSFENGARFARLRPGAAYIEVLQLLERVVRAEFAVDEAMYNAPIPTVILNVAAQRFKHFRLHLAPSFLSAAQRAR